MCVSEMFARMSPAIHALAHIGYISRANYDPARRRHFEFEAVTWEFREVTWEFGAITCHLAPTRRKNKGSGQNLKERSRRNYGKEDLRGIGFLGNWWARPDKARYISDRRKLSRRAWAVGAPLP